MRQLSTAVVVAMMGIGSSAALAAPEMQVLPTADGLTFTAEASGVRATEVDATIVRHALIDSHTNLNTGGDCLAAFQLLLDTVTLDFPNGKMSFNGFGSCSDGQTPGEPIDISYTFEFEAVDAAAVPDVDMFLAALAERTFYDVPMNVKEVFGILVAGNLDLSVVDGDGNAEMLSSGRLERLFVNGAEALNWLDKSSTTLLEPTIDGTLTWIEREFGNLYLNYWRSEVLPRANYIYLDAPVRLILTDRTVARSATGVEIYRDCGELDRGFCLPPPTP